MTESRRRRRRLRALAFPLAAMLILLVGVGAVVAHQTPADEEQTRALREQALELFRRAEAVFNSVEQDRSIRLLTDLINLLERRLEVNDDAELRELLTRSVSYRAQAHYNFGQLEQADADMRRLISLNPGITLDTTTLSPKFVERFEELRAEMVGRLDIILTPSTAELLVDGGQARPSLGPINVLAGERVVTAELPGYSTFRQEVEVAPNEVVEMTIELERVYAVASIITWPNGARVSVDGEMMGVTSGSPPLEFYPVGDAADKPISEFSDYLDLELLPGTYRVAVTKDGYRTAEIVLEIPDLADYEPAPVVLEPSRGDVVLNGVPRGATVTLDEQEITLEDGDRITVEPGEHVVAVNHPSEGYFETTLVVGDGEERQVDAELRPVANLVGIIGADELAASSLVDTLRASFAVQESWILRDRTEDATTALERMTAIQEVLRRGARTGDENLRGIPWRRIQAELDESVPGSLYVLAVLSDDLMATHADVWVLAPAPGPAEPDRIRVAIEDLAAMERFAGRLDLPEFSYRASWGVTVMDAADGGAVVAWLRDDGPAAAAGLQPGDRLVSVGGESVPSAADMERRVAEAPASATLSLVVARGGSQEEIDLVLGESPSVAVARRGDVPAAAVWVAATRALENSGSDVPRWMLQLNAAMAHMRVRDWDGAVRTLRTIEAPDGPGLGRAAVDYLLGVSLLAAGADYESSAREAFIRAAESPHGRLHHDDGPAVRPRALARLGILNEAGSTEER